MVEEIDYVEIFSALGDTTRFKLFKLLAQDGEIGVGQMAEQLGITSASVSQHMKVLANAGLVDRIRMGQKVCYKVSTDLPEKKLLGKMIFNQ